ncbi:DNA alkylation repair protein [Psychromonas ossibalaenae]|uniref:DNA alkylation repair protein n=1 Tax=Psychromonas ossibalaenae TaxID=444922 RepID=UPI00036945CB|nr:DNA alkylation repair protein [Psychromonas ossibalaenae]
MDQLLDELKTYIEPQKAAFFPTFFKAFPGGYGEGDLFWGIRVPPLRLLAKKYNNLSLDELIPLITSKIHEQRMLALFILRLKFEKSSADQQLLIITFYLQYLEGVNNWDLVDSSAHYLLGTWLLDKETQQIWKLADSDNLWFQRIAVMSSFAFIKAGRFELTLQLAEHLLNHPHDLMHKAIGWMLREIGNRDLMVEMQFLDKFYSIMPRTMLRYAIEKFPQPLRLDYLKGHR